MSHLLNGHETITQDHGLFLGESWRLHPDICSFTSEVFYESRLTARAENSNQRLNVAGMLGGTGLSTIGGTERCEMTEEERCELLRESIVELYNEVGSISSTVKNCATKFGSLGWDEELEKAKAQKTLDDVESPDIQTLEKHINALRDSLASAGEILCKYQVYTDQMPGRGGMTGIFVRSGINRVNMLLERTVV